MDRSHSDPLVGTPVLGGYVITGLLGAGGMGSVYVAEHQRIDKKVAIKVLHPHMSANRDIVQRFLAEARAASALDHPNIIKVIDEASFEDGRAYIALEFLDGEALDDVLTKRGRLEPAFALRLLAQVCCGLEAAHHLGIVHRDLKPANLFVAPTELEPLRVKVLDFGIAKLTDTILAGGIETGTSAVAGTPGYMAPEQARGMRNVDHRADIYALGAVAYRMMAATLPYDGESLGEIVYQQLSGPPADVRAHRPELDDGWGEAIMAALDHDPARRPPSARDFALQLAAATPGGEEIAREVAPLLFSEAAIERNRSLVASIVAGLPTLAPATVSHRAPGGTAAYDSAASPPPARPSPVTTLSSAVGAAAAPPAKATSRRWILGAIAAGGIAAASVGIATVAGSDNEPVAASAPPDAALEGETPPPPLDATSVAKPERPLEEPRLVTIELDVRPSEAIVEIGGEPAARPLRLPEGTEHQVVIRRPGYRTEERTIRAEPGATLHVRLQRKIRPTFSKPRPKPAPTGPVSTTLEPDKPRPKPKGPITDTL